MIKIFEHGAFSTYSQVRLDESRSSVLEHSQYGVRSKTTVFISHKHDDLEDLKGILGFLQQRYGVKVYIDSQDPSMPPTTSAETALNIKERIKQCNKFILLATNGAIESKWCNWELGYGDAQKFKKNIALFPMKPKGAYDSAYKGSEYMSIYPYIAYFDGTEKYKSGRPIERGYYVRTHEKDGNYITPLVDWFNDV
ncbi:MAG: toll/interleukin-1 receptor domain-containing protein [Clostridia bacterium]|nr:toll/interleukin-1 receptor domain-containing protein [Clostridia bacterium]